MNKLIEVFPDATNCSSILNLLFIWTRSNGWSSWTYSGNKNFKTEKLKVFEN